MILTSISFRIGRCSSNLRWLPSLADGGVDVDLGTAKIDKSTFHGKLNFHALRVTHVTMGIELGFDAKTAQELARHKTPDMTMNIYAKANPDRIRKAVDALGKAVSDAENTHNSRTGVKRQVLAKAAGAENLTEAPAMPGDATGAQFGAGERS